MFKKAKHNSQKFFCFLASLLVLFQSFLNTSLADEIVIEGNSNESQNQISIEISSNNSIFQENNANNENDISTSANSGENNLSQNSGTESTLNTGDISSQVAVSNTSNISSVETGCCPGDTSLTITQNGSNSQNTITQTNEVNTNVGVSQYAVIENNVEGVANTGDNLASRNNGNVSITTGDIKTTTQVINGDLNLTFVKVNFGVGDVSSLIANNSSDSTNTINSVVQNTLSLFTYSLAEVSNNVGWVLNTGNNTASKNVGGVSMSTGDILSHLIIKNEPLNISSIEVFCCRVIPGQEEEEKGEGGIPSEEEEEEKGGDGEEKKEVVSGQILPEAAAIEAGGPGILGLSDTGSDAAKSLFNNLGLIMVLLGVFVVFREYYYTASAKGGRN